MENNSNAETYAVTPLRLRVMAAQVTDAFLTSSKELAYHGPMPIATVTSKGQITIPVEVREAMRIRPGTRVQFFLRDDGVYEFIPITRSMIHLKGMFADGGPPVTLEEMEEAIGEAAVERYERSR